MALFHWVLGSYQLPGSHHSNAGMRHFQSCCAARPPHLDTLYFMFMWVLAPGWPLVRGVLTMAIQDPVMGSSIWHALCCEWRAFPCAAGF